eukprot:268764_1
MSTVFKDTSGCISEQNDISQCISAQRIKIILTKFHEIVDTNNTNKSNNLTKKNNSNDVFIQLVNEIFLQNNYSNTQLVDDYHHIQDHHQVDDDETFDKIFQYFTNNMTTQCDIQKCHHIKTHYRDRSE